MDLNKSIYTMSYLNKYNNLRVEVITHLKEILKTKKYDVSEIWNDEKDDTAKYDLPQESYQDDGFYDVYYLVFFDPIGESFLGYTVEDNEEFWFTFDDLSIYNLCWIADHLNNEQV